LAVDVRPDLFLKVFPECRLDVPGDFQRNSCALRDLDDS
jgi:hypothetical protein